MSRLKGNSNIVSYENHQVIEHKNGIGWDILIQMELLSPLNRYTADHAVTAKDVIRLGADLCRALELCQTYHIIHRDVKPANIFYGEDKVVRLGDFGLSRIINDANPVSTFGSTLPLVGFPRETLGQLASLQFIGFRHDDTHRNTNLRVTGTIRGEFHLRLQK